MPAAVVVDSLSKRYGQIEAIRGVSFEVAAGEVFGLLGPNGAGKTTTMECVLGLRQADGGSVAIDGIDAVANPNRVKHRIGAQLQATALQDKITPREALKLFRSFYERGLGATELIERFRLKEIADAPFAGLSAGQKQRVAIALAFVNDPAVVFLDEPTSGLDAHSRRDVYAAIESMR